MINREQDINASVAMNEVQRSKFNRDSQTLVTFNAGLLIPFYRDFVLAGDTFEVNTNVMIRSSTPLRPVMDRAYLDTYYFYVPKRLLWSNWKNFIGENTTDKWAVTTQYQIPQIAPPHTTGWDTGTIADYLGYPVGVTNATGDQETFDHLLIRAYIKIWNDFFWDQNNQEICNMSLGGIEVTGENVGPYKTNAELGAEPLPVCKFHDYLTSCLPDTQKGQEQAISLGDVAPLTVRITGGTTVVARTALDLENTDVVSGSNPVSPVQVKGHANLKLEADLKNATGIKINDLREKTAIQRYLELNARTGTRQNEYYKAHFNVNNTDSRLQRAEYLGGEHIPLNMEQVAQTSQSTVNTAKPLESQLQGDMAGYSLTGNREHSFTKSFTEHGYLIGVCCVRTEQSYQNNVERELSKKDLLEFYDPMLANLGEQAVLNKEAVYLGKNTDNDVLGFTPAWQEYRVKQNMITGQFRSKSGLPLDSWHYANDFKSHPTLPSLVTETLDNVDRTLGIKSSVVHQFIARFEIGNTTTREMPVHSIPRIVG